MKTQLRQCIRNGLDIRPPKKTSFKANLIISDEGHPMLMDPKDPDTMWYSLEPCPPELEDQLLLKSYNVYYPVPLGQMDRETHHQQDPLNLQNVLYIDFSGKSTKISLT